MVDSVGRVFVAVPLPPEITHALAERMSEMRIPGKIGPPENWHITLRFLDTIDRVTYERFLSGLEALGDEFAFPFTLEGFGAFPRPSKATVFWVGVGRGSAELTLLNEIVEDAAVGSGLLPEERPFHPHLTLARIRPPVDVRDLVQEDLSLSLRCDRIIVYRSHLGRGPARYEPLDRVDLIG